MKVKHAFIIVGSLIDLPPSFDINLLYKSVQTREVTGELQMFEVERFVKASPALNYVDESETVFKSSDFGAWVKRLQDWVNRYKVLPVAYRAFSNDLPVLCEVNSTPTAFVASKSLMCDGHRAGNGTTWVCVHHLGDGVPTIDHLEVPRYDVIRVINRVVGKIKEQDPSLMVIPDGIGGHLLFKENKFVSVKSYLRQPDLNMVFI